MNILIIEDEAAAQSLIKSMLRKIVPNINILAVIDSIDDAVAWLSTHDEPDIIFADIQLSDGICFDIFKQIQPRCAVIFTTAFDKYAVDAFKVNSIDYLLKPIHFEDLEKSINKYHSLKQTFSSENTHKLKSLLSLLDQKDKAYNTRFLVKSGQTMKPILTSDIAYVMIDSQLVFFIHQNGKRYLVEHTLDELEKKLDPSKFFRINRQMIVSLNAVKAIHAYFNSRLKLDLEPHTDKDVLVSRMKVVEFKSWLER